MSASVPSKLPVHPFTQWAKEWVATHPIEVDERPAEGKARARAAWNDVPPPEERFALEEAFLADRVAYYLRYSDQPENQVQATKYTSKLAKLRALGAKPPAARKRKADDRSPDWEELKIGKKTFFKHRATGEVAHRQPYKTEAMARVACAPRKFTARTAFAHDNKSAFGSTRSAEFRAALKAKLESSEGLKELEERAEELNACGEDDKENEAPGYSGDVPLGCGNDDDEEF